MKTTTINGKLYNVVKHEDCVGCAFKPLSTACYVAPSCGDETNIFYPRESIIFVATTAPQPGDKSQNGRILNHLQSGASINPMQALRLYGCFRLASRIWDLTQAGYEIDSMPGYNPRTKKRYSVYFLKETT